MVKIPYFGKFYLNKHIFHKILYSFESKFYESGDIIIAQGDIVDKVIFVVNGELEIFTEFEGNEFVFETLKPGSILNYRNIFTDDKMQVSVRSKVDDKGTIL